MGHNGEGGILRCFVTTLSQSVSPGTATESASPGLLLGGAGFGGGGGDFGGAFADDANTLSGCPG